MHTQQWQVHKENVLNAKAAECVSGSCGLQMFSIPLQLLKLQRSVDPEGQGAEAQRHRNRMEHEVTFKVSLPRAPQTPGTRSSL